MLDYVVNLCWIHSHQATIVFTRAIGIPTCRSDQGFTDRAVGTLGEFIWISQPWISLCCIQGGYLLCLWHKRLNQPFPAKGFPLPKARPVNAQNAILGQGYSLYVFQSANGTISSVKVFVISPTKCIGHRVVVYRVGCTRSIIPLHKKQILHPREMKQAVRKIKSWFIQICTARCRIRFYFSEVTLVFLQFYGALSALLTAINNLCVIT